MTKQMVHTVDVGLPVRTVYNQWTQFEDFPLFMKHVTSVEQLDPTHLRWQAKIAGVSRSWDAEITEQLPDQRIAWKAVDGVHNDGVVTFHRLADDATRVTLQLDVDPEGFLETVAAKGGMVDDRAEKDLLQFKEFIETRGRETGGYRGRVEHETSPDHAGTIEFGGDDDATVDLRDDGGSADARRSAADEGRTRDERGDEPALVDEHGEPLGRRA